MKYDPEIHRRRSIRLKGYDYTRSGAYFVTICAQNRECLFGKVENGRVFLNSAGEMLRSVWEGLPVFYTGVEIDSHMIMPNHFHGIIWIVGAGPRACPVFDAGPGKGHPQGGAPTLSLPDVVHRFKSMTTAMYRHAVNHRACPPFPGRLWQRNYYDRVIRNDDELRRAREYIANNPVRWATDDENPANHPP